MKAPARAITARRQMVFFIADGCWIIDRRGHEQVLSVTYEMRAPQRHHRNAHAPEMAFKPTPPKKSPEWDQLHDNGISQK